MPGGLYWDDVSRAGFGGALSWRRWDGGGRESASWLRRAVYGDLDGVIVCLARRSGWVRGCRRTKDCDFGRSKRWDVAVGRRWWAVGK